MTSIDPGGPAAAASDVGAPASGSHPVMAVMTPAAAVVSSFDAEGSGVAHLPSPYVQPVSSVVCVEATPETEVSTAVSGASPAAEVSTVLSGASLAVEASTQSSGERHRLRRSEHRP